jgi:genome maintenance exonuclease 1
MKPKPAISRDRYHRYTYEGTIYPGWTSIGKIVDKSEALMTWATRRAVAGVLDQLDALPAMLANNDRTEVINMLAKRSAWDRDKAGSRGSTIHDHADRIVRGLEPVDVAVELRKPVAAIAEWWASCGWTLRLSEAYVVNPALGYAGTFDLLARDQAGLTVLADWKSGRMYPEHRLQLLAYASAQFIAPADSPVAYPMPAVDRHVVLLVTDDGVEPVEVEIDDSDRAAFLACIPLARWKASHERKWKS